MSVHVAQCLVRCYKALQSNVTQRDTVNVDDDDDAKRQCRDNNALGETASPFLPTVLYLSTTVRAHFRLRPSYNVKLGRC